MTRISPERTVAELVVEAPGRSRVFEELGIDYCCGGRRSLASACAERGLDADAVAARLAEVEVEGGQEGEDWAAAPLSALCDHIVEIHHAFLRRELPLLGALVDKVARVHGDAHPKLLETQEHYGAVAAELRIHMAEEEEMLFPACRRLEESGESGLDSLADAVAELESDHAATGAALERIRLLNRDFAPPADACNSYRAMLDRLETLERDLHRHIHEENNILFPRAAAREAQSAGAPGSPPRVQE
jgi:regulator of cell morphogenesis and NO signaling